MANRGVVVRYSAMHICGTFTAHSDIWFLVRVGGIIYADELLADSYLRVVKR